MGIKARIQTSLERMIKLGYVSIDLESIDSTLCCQRIGRLWTVYTIPLCGSFDAPTYYLRNGRLAQAKQILEDAIRCDTIDVEY